MNLGRNHGETQGVGETREDQETLRRGSLPPVGETPSTITVAPRSRSLPLVTGLSQNAQRRDSETTINPSQTSNQSSVSPSRLTCYAGSLTGGQSGRRIPDRDFLDTQTNRLLPFGHPPSNTLVEKPQQKLAVEV